MAAAAWAQAPSVTNIAATTQNGQTFLTWTDAASGSSGANYRYNIYRSTSQITSLGGATLIMPLVRNNSSQLVPATNNSSWTNATILQNSGYLQDIISQGSCPANGICGTPLAAFTGLAVHTATTNQSAYYAVITHDITGAQADSPISAGNNSMTSSVSETTGTAAPLQYYKGSTNTSRGSTSYNPTATTRPLFLKLHASGGCPAQLVGPGGTGDMWIGWGDSTMGYMEGRPLVFQVWEAHTGASWTVGGFNQAAKVLNPCDQQWLPDAGSLSTTDESTWSGFLDSRTGASGTGDGYYHLWGEAAQTWQLNWVIANYAVDANHVYATGQSLGGWGAAGWAIRHPEIFAAIFPSASNWLWPIAPQILSTGGFTEKNLAPTDLMSDGVTPISTHFNMPAYAAANCGSLVPVINGMERGDNTWPNQWLGAYAMTKQMQACHAAFAIAWGTGTHSDATTALGTIADNYSTAYAKNVSYPAFANSSLDGNIGTWAAQASASGAVLTVIKSSGTTPAVSSSVWVSGGSNSAPSQYTVSSVSGSTITMTSSITCSGCTSLAAGNGDGSGTVNKGWQWSIITDTSTEWKATVSNTQNSGTMTADVTPRNLQSFSTPAGTWVYITNSAGSPTLMQSDSTGTVTLAAAPITGTTTLDFKVAPSLIVTPASLTFACSPSGSAPPAQTVSITGANVTLDNWSASKTQTWLSLSATSGSAAGSTNASVACGSLSAGTYTDTITVASTTAGIVNSPQTVAVTMQVATPSITTTSLPNGTAGQAYSQTLAATGGTLPYTWTIDSGTLCAGLSLTGATGVIAGTPPVAGSCSFTVRVTDAISGTSTQPLSITIVDVGRTTLSGGLTATNGVQIR